MGHQKEINIIMNTIVPKNLATSYSADIEVDQALMKRFRTVMMERNVSFGERGFTKADMVGPGKLGSLELLKEGLARGM